MKLELSFKVKTQHGGVEKEMEREYTYCYTLVPQHPYSILIYLNWTQMRHRTLPERVQQERKETKTTTTTKGPIQKPKNRNVWELIQWNWSCHIKKNTTRRRDKQRGVEVALTVSHICYRARIPFWHVCIERRCAIEHCKRVQQERETRTSNWKKTECENW